MSKVVAKIDPKTRLVKVVIDGTLTWIEALDLLSVAYAMVEAARDRDEMTRFSGRN